MHARTLALLLAVIGLAVGVAGLATADVTQIDDDHELATNEAIDEFENEGVATGEANVYDIDLTVAEDRRDVGLDPSLLGSTGNDYLRVEYHEDFERTLRLYLPREYATPYTRNAVYGVNNDEISAEYRPSDDGEYLVIMFDVDGPTDVVLPLDKTAQTGYGIVEAIDDRAESIAGVSLRDDSDEWQQIEREKLSEQASIPVSDNPDDTLVQVDAQPDSSSRLWVNAPSGDAVEGISARVKETPDGDTELHVVSTEGNPSDVRLKHNYTRTDYWRGEVNNARLIPQRAWSWATEGDISLPSWLPGV